MAKKKTPPKPIESYEHTDKESANNSHIGIVNGITAQINFNQKT